MSLSASDLLSAATHDADAAVNDPARRSRWPWIKRRAQERWWASDERAKGLADVCQEQLIAEAVARVAARERPLRPWHRPDVGAVLQEVRAVSRHVIATEESVATLIYRDQSLDLRHEDLTLVQEHVRALPDELFALITGRSYIAKPNGGSGLGLDDEEQLATALVGEHARLARPITLWRGEHPAERYPHFAEAVLDAQPGDILERPRPLSCSLDPRVAAGHEFTHVGTLQADRTVTDGWVLEITTDRALYAGDRQKRTGIPDGLARAEKEALFYAPQLEVAGHRETLVRCRRTGLKRVHVVACSPATV